MISSLSIQLKKPRCSISVRTLGGLEHENESVEVENPSLDDVFAAVTGSTLDGAAADSSAA